MHVLENKVLFSYGMPAAELDSNAVRSQLERVLASGCFRRNQRLGRFLRFVVELRLEGKESEIKESVIAIEVFGRKSDHISQTRLHRSNRGRQAPRAIDGILCR